MDDRLRVQLLRREEWKAFLQVKSHLVAKDTQSTCASAIGFLSSVIEDMPEKIEVCLHEGSMKIKIKIKMKKRNAIRRSPFAVRLFKPVSQPYHLAKQTGQYP